MRRATHGPTSKYGIRLSGVPYVTQQNSPPGRNRPLTPLNILSLHSPASSPHCHSLSFHKHSHRFHRTNDVAAHDEMSKSARVAHQQRIQCACEHGTPRILTCVNDQGGSNSGSVMRMEWTLVGDVPFSMTKSKLWSGRRPVSAMTLPTIPVQRRPEKQENVPHGFFSCRL